MGEEFDQLLSKVIRVFLKSKWGVQNGELKLIQFAHRSQDLLVWGNHSWTGFP
jgi:hypothetical protein